MFRYLAIAFVFIWLADCAPAQILWTEGHEDGTFGEWLKAGKQSNTSREVTDARAHSGTYSMALTVHDAPADSSTGVRMKFEGAPLGSTADDPKNLPDEAYYSAWYYIPQRIIGVNNIFQYKQKHDSTSIRCMSFSLFDMTPRVHIWTGTGLHPGSTEEVGRSPVEVPVGEWFHFEVWRRWSTSSDGGYICWLNGEEIMRREGIITQYSNISGDWLRKWLVNNYAIKGGQDPATHTIYIDDSKLSSTRVGTTEPEDPVFDEVPPELLERQAQLLSDIVAVEAEIAELEQEIAELKEDIEALKAKIAKFEKLLKDGHQLLDEMKADLAALEADLAALETQLAALKEELAALQAELAAVEEEIASYE